MLQDPYSIVNTLSLASRFVIAQDMDFATLQTRILIIKEKRMWYISSLWDFSSYSWELNLDSNNMQSN